MRSRKIFWIGLCLLLLAGAWFFWPAGDHQAKTSPAPRTAAKPDLTAARATTTNVVSATKTNPFPFRLTNTTKPLKELMADRKAILLDNALIDTGAKLDLGIPKNLRAAGDPGAYIVQARGPVNAAFRAELAAAGAEIISYIPNNAYLVRATPAAAQQLAARTQAVIPYEPYYKVQSPLLAFAQQALPVGRQLNLGLFAASAADTLKQIAKLGGAVLATDHSPFGPVVRVEPPKNWTALAALPGVQIVEAAHPRGSANDLSRQSTGVAVDTITQTNYLNLNGANVLVQVNDSGIDATHPDLIGRIFGPLLTDTNGHGTFVAGIIAGDGTKSTTVTNAQGSINPGTNGQYRGKAPLATLFSMPFFISDKTLQETAALTNALISNNSWNYIADNSYNLAAASYDAAVRDALTQVPGSQPVLFVFSSGNDGGGNNSGGGGDSDTILSPATAKNVITVGALEQLRNITNVVTDVDSNTAAVWQPQTDSNFEVARGSGRGNVGVGTEGANGRYKPDVVAPGTFVVSTRSQQWDEVAYYNPTNYSINTYITQTIGTNGDLNPYSISVPPNAVAVIITLVANQFSPVPFPTNLPVYVDQFSRPTTTVYDFVTWHNGVSIPPDSGPGITGIGSIQNDGFYFSVGNTNNFPISYDLITSIVTTNDQGDYFQVLSNLNNSISGTAPYFYRYESGTSMAAADVSGVLALMQDFFTNTLHTAPSPGLLKAMLINGARVTGNYNFNQASEINFEGWGEVNLPNSLPQSITNLVTNPTGGTNTSVFFLDQSVTNALATGDSQTFVVAVNTNSSSTLPLRVTLAWTDPAGNPAAAIKLVNNLDLVVTNLDTGEVYIGNAIAQDSVFNAPLNTNAPPLFDSVNNIENVFLAPPIGANYSVTVIGRGVNVNAVTAQTNNPAGVYAPNVVQDYSLVISCGDSFDGGAISVTANPVNSNPTASQLITFVIATNTPLLNQLVGANTPLMGTNQIGVGTNTQWGTNGNITLGMTNQWHFYVVTNVLGYPYAGFITFIPSTLSLPRTGVYADSLPNSTQSEADIDLYVADPHQIVNSYNLTNLDPTVIVACNKSLTRGGVEFVTYSNSAPGDVYYIGVKSEAQEGSEYGFIPIFSPTPFSSEDAQGNLTVFGVPLPVTIPDGSTRHPGKGYVFGIAVTPITVERVVVTNTIVHENFSDLIGTLSHNGKAVVLNDHAYKPNPPGPYTSIYDDSGRGDIPGSQPSDGPGTLQTFRAQEGVGPWILTEVDDSLTQTGAVTGLTIFIEKHQDLNNGVYFSVLPGAWFYTYLDVPPGYTNLTIYGTNLPPTVQPPLQMYLDYNVQPNFSNYLDRADLTNCIFGTYPTGPNPGNSISYGPPLRSGTYYVGVFNPSAVRANGYLLARLSGQAVPPPVTPASTNGPSLLDDALTSTTVFVSSTQLISTVSVGVVVDHPRISDLTFTLLSPTGERVLLMENRGGSTTNAGDTFLTTNNFAPVTATGGGLPETNYLHVGQTSGSLLISWDFFQVPDEMTVYYGTNAPFDPATAIFDTGLVSNSGSTNLLYGPGTFTDVTIIMNQLTNSAGAGGTRWTYTVGGVQTNYNYLMFTEDTNLTAVPIKFAIPPFNYTATGTNYALSDFDLATNGNYLAPTNIYDAHGGWSLTNITAMFVGTNLVFVTNNANMVSVVTDPANAASGSNFLALASGSMFRQVPMTPGRQFSLSFNYRGPGISGWWRGEGNATDSANPENLGNNGELIGRFSFPAGEVGQAFSMEFAGSQFQFAGTNTYVQIRQVPFTISVPSTTESNLPTRALSSALDVGTGPGFTVEGWINPTNVSFQQPLVEWLARTPTNLAGTNVVILAGPFLNPATSHYYYLLGSTNWTVSENWATQLGGHLVTIDTANEQNWVYDTFASYGGTNRNLWIGLTNNAPGATTNYVWSSGLTNTGYFNWQTNQPNFCTPNQHYTAMLGQTNALPGLWFVADNTGLSCTFPATNKMFGVVEVPELQPNGVQFWVSVTNAPGTTNLVVGTNGCLFANLVDTTNGSHYIFSAPGLVATNVYQHVALTYNTNSGIASLYYNGTNVASTNLGYFLPKTTGDVLLGKDMSRATNNFFGGKMDEMSIYARSLSDAEILAIYNVSFLTTNRNLGKFDPTITPALGLAEARVSFGPFTNVLLGQNESWQSQNFSFTVTSNSMPLMVSGIEPGMLLDSFNVSEQPLGNLYYFPEEPLSVLKNQNAFGTWTLQILDNRTGAYITNVNQLVSWQLQLVLQDNTLAAVDLGAEEATTISVPPGEIVHLTVAVPAWATAATNILVSSTLPVDLLFNQTNAPTGNVPPDYQFLTASTGGFYTMTTAAVPAPQLLPGQTYHLGVRNPGSHSATVVLRVAFDIPTLTNAVPVTDVVSAGNSERYYVFNVTSNAYAATFQLLKLNGNADLVVRKGTPLPTLISSDYGSFNTTNADENIYVLTNSAPVPLSAGPWYLGVFNRDAAPVRYTVLAKELDTPSPTIIELTNGVPFNFSAGPGAALTNFFHFAVTNSPPSVHFELYNLSGNGDLTVQTNALPLAPPFFQSSQLPGTLPEFISISTNYAQTNLNTTALTNLALDWYLGVPNRSTNLISYTILALIDTNSVFPAFPGAEGAGAGSLGGGSLPSRNGGITNTVYHVINVNDSGAGSLRDAVSSTNRTVVFDVSGTINLLSPLVITNSYLTLAGQTAPGGGITVAGAETRLANVHDVIIRAIRFRRGAIDDSLMFTNVANVIADHVSAEWSDTVMSTLNSSNVTVQWSILSDSLRVTNNPPPAANSLRYGTGVLTFHHNLYANNFTGSPQLNDNLSLDFVNNVIYGWGTNAGFSFGTNNPSGATNQMNYVCNYLIAGTNSFARNIAFRGGSTNTWIFQTNNFIDSNTNYILDGAPTGWAMFTNQFTQFEHPFPLPPVSTDEAYLAYERVLDFAGLSLFARDAVDTNIVTGVRNQTGTIISAPPLSGMVAWWKAEGNGLDSVGSNNGAPTAGITYTNGEVGQAFVFNGATTSFVPVAATPTLNNIGANGSGFTIECWVKAPSTANGPILEWDSATADGLQFWVQPNGQLLSNIKDTSGTSHTFFTTTGVLNPSSFQHVALTYDKKSGNAFIYRNGIVVGSANFGSIIPQTTFSNLRIGLRSASAIGTFAYTGLIDELSVYKRALSSSEIAFIYGSGSAGKSPAIAATALPPLDSDQDGIPDYWEITFGQFPTNVSDYLPSTHSPGYTDLEEYLNWLGAPHAVTITNTSVGVDLYQLCGNSGTLSFFLTNAVNGSVYLTNVLGSVTNTGPFSNSIAIFTPFTNYSGYAGFDFFVTNNATVAYFGPVTVSVVVSAVPIIYGAVNTNAPVFAATPTNQTVFELTTLTVTNAATDLDTNQTLSYVVTMIVDTNAMVASNWPTLYATTTPSPVIDANGIITWTPSESQGPGVYLITTVVNDSGIPSLSATNSFSVTVNEVNHAPFWPPGVPSQTNYSISATTLLTVTNTATDSDIPTNTLTYALSVSPTATNAVISTNGIITWTPDPTQLGLFTFTTIVTDTNLYALSNQSLTATNTFTVFVSAVAGPFVFTQPAQAVTGSSAQLNGMATPNGLPTRAWFEWGTTTNYGSLTPAVNVGAGYNVVYTTNGISGLLTNVPYHFRLVAANAVGTNYGFDQILDEANVVVWGANFAGQATVPSGLSNVVAIAGAYNHSLALKNNGTAVGWGDNLNGQSTVPAALNNNLVAVAGGETYSIALKASGTVVAWGADYYPGAGETNVPPGLNNVVGIASGQFSSLALRNNGTVTAWGANLFNPTNGTAGLSNAVAIAGGTFHGLAIKHDGTVVAWGDNSAGQTNVPAGLSNVVAIAAGNYHNLALKKDGTVVAWGYNNAGQTNVPAGLSNVVAIAAGHYQSLALKNDGSVVGWGDNSVGQRNPPGGLTNFVAISAGDLHSLALTPQAVLNVTNPIVTDLTNGVADTNAVLAGSINFYRINVPLNADFATNLLFVLNTNQTLNLLFTTNPPPSVTTLLLAGVTNGISILNTTSAPPRIVPGSTYYLGVQNTNSFPVSYGIEVDFHLLTSTNTLPQTNTVPISSILYTNIGGTNGFLLTWFAPSNDLFQVQFSDTLVPVNWITFSNIISYNTNAFTGGTNTQFNFFDDGSAYPFTGLRFYRLILLGTGSGTNTAPVLSSQPDLTVNPLNPLVVTNTATDAQSPPQMLTYTLVNPPVGAGISTNGIITWTPTVAQAGTSNTITTLVTDNGTPSLSATNAFTVIVSPVPTLTGVTFTNGNFLLTWWAPTNDIFQVQFSDSLVPVNWQNFSTLVSYTGPATATNGLFSFLDDGVEHPFTGLRFYQIKLVGVNLPATKTVPISSIVATNGNFLLTWFAATTNQFNVLSATNLATPLNWTFLGGPITSTNGTFTFLDTNAPMLMKFYELILLP